MLKAREDVLAFRHFSDQHWRQAWSTNLLEHVNAEIKRRTRVVGIFPNAAAITRLVGAILLKQDEHWQLEGGRMFSAESMAAIPTLEELPVPPSLQCPGAGSNQRGTDSGVSQQPSTNPGEWLDKSIVWIHRETTRHTCASRMTERHSSLFTLRSGQSGLGIYTTERDAAATALVLYPSVRISPIAMPASSSSQKPPADIDKTAARRFPLVHQLIHFADLRNFYREMREALISANRRAGAQKGLVTKAKKKIAQLEAEMTLLEQERDELLTYRQRVEQEANQISAVLPRLKGKLLQVRQIEQALENLADIKEAVDQQEQAHGGPTRLSTEDLKRAVERLLERADAVEFLEESVEEIERAEDEQGQSDEH